MRKIILVILIFTLLTGCNVFPAGKSTLTSAEMATRVALLLTAMPTATGGPQMPTESLDLLTPTEPTGPMQGEIGVIASPTVEETLSSPTPDETTMALLKATPTPPISMPSATPTATVAPTATTTPTGPLKSPAPTNNAAADPRTLLPAPTWTDLMDTGSNWPTGSDSYTSIDFKDGFMVLSGMTKDNGWRLAINDVDNAYFETTAKFGSICKGMDRWGMMIRVPDRASANKGYWFNITCDGKYAFQKWNATPPDGESSVTNIIAWSSNNNIKTGADAVNRLGILAKGGQFTLYINGVQVDKAADNSFVSGGFGVLVGAKETNNFTIYVDELSYWMNPNM